jgi:16S rRNA (cytidine1402-2'-O)-methyltransferase
MPGILYVVATPIGNLEDITLRALRILREVSLIAAEDTRRTARLLQHYSISTPTTSLHEHNERQRTGHLIGRLLEGDSVALVSDAGTPAISDPGAALVAAARQAGVRVEPVPGASAALSVLSAAGLEGTGFLFVGFPPHRSFARKEWLSTLSHETVPVLLYEAPHRIRQFLGDTAEIMPWRRLIAGRELTKAHEEIVEGTASELLARFGKPKGEFTVIITPEPPGVPLSLDSQTPAVLAEFHDLTRRGLTTRRAVKEVARRRGLGAREVYDAVLADKNRGGQTTE